MTTRDEHFTLPGTGTPTRPGRYVDVAAIPEAELVPGLHFRPVLGERTMVNFVSFEPHTSAPRHAHEEEQTVVVIDGELTFDLDGDVRVMRRNDVAVVPPWVPHAAWTEDGQCFEMDVFNPPRRTLIDHSR
ncbi:MAG: cupin domain-containing protein [Acidimicrobiales bacterium]